MRVFIGFESALRFLLANGLHRERAVYGRRFQRLEETRARPVRGQGVDTSLIRSSGFPDGVGEEPVTLCVASAADRRIANCIHARSWNGPERGTYLSVDDIYCVATPEAMFVQMANDLCLAHLIELGYMLCGSYIPEGISAARHSNLLPLTTASKLKRYLNKCSNVNGAKNARKALRWIVDGSASVMETRLAMFLILSPLYGGYGLPVPELNKPIRLPEKLATRTVTNQRKPDLYWASKRVALEYDSKREHSGENKVSRDRRRANELEAANIKMFSAGPKDLYDPLALDNLAVQIARALGYRIRTKQSDYMQKRAMLRRDLLGAGEWDLLKLPLDTARWI